jgi:hypothetical protein
VVIGLAVLLVLGTAFAVVRIELDGPRLGAKIASFLNKGRRGRIEIDSIEWPASGLKAAITGGWVPVQLRGLRVWDDCALADSNADPEELRTRDPNQDCTPDDKPDPDPASKRKPRKLLLRTDLLTAEIDVHAVMFGNHDIVLRHVVMHGGEALIEQTREPQPLHAYNKTIVSLVTAFYPRLKAGFRAGIYADQAPPVFDLRDIHLEHVNLTVHVAPYTKDAANIGFGMAAHIEDVNVDADAQPKNDAYLYMDGRDPLVQKFYFRLSANGKHGVVRILDEGPRSSFRISGEGGLADAWGKGRNAKYQIELASIDLKRLAQLPLNWSHLDKKRGYDYVANTLEVDGTIRTLPCNAAPDAKDGAELHVTGGLANYWDRPYDGKWDFKLEANNLGPTVRTCIKSTVGGEHMGGTVAISGPFIALPRVDVDMHDVDLDIPLSKKEEPIRLTLDEVHAGIDLVNDEGYIDQSKAREREGKEGEVMLSARFGLKPYHATASVDILKPLDIGRFLPARVVKGVGPLLTGKLSVDGDLETGFKIYDFSVGLGPSSYERRVLVSASPRENAQVFATDYFEHIRLQRIHFEGGQSHATINGRIDYGPDPNDPTKPLDWQYGITIDGVYPDADRWLKLFGLPAFIQKASGAQVVITGRGNKPTITVDAALQGVPCLGTVQGRSTTQAGVTSLRISSGGLGGTLTGDGVINTQGAQAVIEKLHLTGTKLEAAKLCGLNGVASGTIDNAELDLKGTIDPKRAAIDWAALAKIYASSQHATVLGDRYSDIAVCINRTDADDTKLCRRSANVVTQVGLTDCTNAKAHNGFCAVARATRDRGGSLDATIANVPALRTKGAPTDAHLGGDIKLDDVPMAVIEPLVGPGTVGGLFSAVLHLSGEPLTAQRMAPQASGTLDLLRGWVGAAFLGDIKLEILPTTISTPNGLAKGLLVRGGALANGLTVSASIGTETPYPVAVQIAGRRVDVDQFVDLGKKLGVSEPVQAWASGTLTLYTELAPKSRQSQPEAWLEVTELEATLDHTSRDGRHVPLRFGFRPGSNGLALSLRVTPATVELACRDPQSRTGMSPCPAKLDTPAGVVSIEGSATPTGMSVKAIAKQDTGLLDLHKLAPLLENQLDDISGKVALEMAIKGTMIKPDYDAKLTVVETAKLRPTGSDTELQIAKDSEVELVNGTLGFNSFTVQVKDDRKEQQGAMHVKGTLALEGFRPAVWGVLIDGQIAGKLLQVIAPSAIAQASGLARIEGDMVLHGKGLLPQIDATITFDPAIASEELTGTEGLSLARLRPAPLVFVPRGLRNEIALENGSLQIKTEDTGGHRTYTLSTNEDPVTATIDGEGRLKNVEVVDFEIRDGKPYKAKIDLDADNVPFRIPQTLDLVLAANDVELEYDNDRWLAHGKSGTAGNVAIVSGKYLRNFDLAEAIKPVPPTIAPAKPWWDTYPSIGNADLDLVLDVRRFSVEDNIAQIDLTGSGIAITGSPRDVRLQGSISVQRGDFKIPLTRARFTRSSGTIDFAANDRAANPTLSINSEAPEYTDLSGQQHVISLAITGTLEQPLWDLKTNTGLDKSQTIALLFLGRNPEQLRRSLGDSSIGVVNATAGDQSTNPSGTFGDQLVKDLAGDWVSSLIGSSLQNVIGLDVLRFELGFGSVKAHVEKKVLENIKLIGEYETTTRGLTYDANLEIRTPVPLPQSFRVLTNSRLSLQGGVLEKQYNDPADQALNVGDLQAKLVYRLFIP